MRPRPWRIAYIVEPAEGWFEPRGGQLRWRPPAAGETHHSPTLAESATAEFEDVHLEPEPE